MKILSGYKLFMFIKGRVNLSELFLVYLVLNKVYSKRYYNYLTSTCLFTHIHRVISLWGFWVSAVIAAQLGHFCKTHTEISQHESGEGTSRKQKQHGRSSKMKMLILGMVLPSRGSLVRPSWLMMYRGMSDLMPWPSLAWPSAASNKW